MFTELDNRADIIHNKYYVWYKKIISFRKNNPIEGYVERHHIIPKSMGGNNSKVNLVQLTAREHFICHLCLAKCTAGESYYRMVNALRRSSHISPKHAGKYIKINSKIYEFIKREFSKANSVFSKQRWQTPEYREKMLKNLTDNVHNNEQTKKKISDSVKALHKDPIYRENYLKQHADKFTDEVKQGMSEKALSRWRDPEQVGKMAQIRNRPEHKANIAAKAKARWADPAFREKMKNRKRVTV